MPTHANPKVDPQALAYELQIWREQQVISLGVGTRPVKPGHRVPFHWPPHPISHSYHLHKSDWTGRATYTCLGETFEAVVARSPHGVFGRSVPFWNEARGDTEEEMLDRLSEGTEPIVLRQRVIAETLGLNGRFEHSIRDLPPTSLLKLLYCRDRDVAREARLEIESAATSGIYTKALVSVLLDDTHPFRASAQWSVLDMFEDLPAFAPDAALRQEAIHAVKTLIWNAPNDFARTTFKAGVVVGGHMPSEVGGPILLECLGAPSKFGRRSAIHGLFHVVEWAPTLRANVVSALRKHAEIEAEPTLKSFALDIATDLEHGSFDHVDEPLFADEP